MLLNVSFYCSVHDRCGDIINFNLTICPFPSLWAGAFQDAVVMWRQRMINVDMFLLWCRSPTWQVELYGGTPIRLYPQAEQRYPCAFGEGGCSCNHFWPRHWMEVNGHTLCFVLTVITLRLMLTRMQQHIKARSSCFPKPAWRQTVKCDTNTETAGLHKVTGSPLLWRTWCLHLCESNMWNVLTQCNAYGIPNAIGTCTILQRV